MSSRAAIGRAVAGVLAFLAGLVATIWVCLRLSYRWQGFDPERDPGSADCDDCGLVAILEALPVIAVGVGLYIVTALVIWLMIRGRDTRE